MSSSGLIAQARGIQVTSGAFDAMAATGCTLQTVIVSHEEEGEMWADGRRVSLQYVADSIPILIVTDPSYPDIAAFLGLLPEGSDWYRHSSVLSLPAIEGLNVAPGSSIALILREARQDLAPIIAAHRASGRRCTTVALHTGASICIETADDGSLWLRAETEAEHR